MQNIRAILMLFISLSAEFPIRVNKNKKTWELYFRSSLILAFALPPSRISNATSPRRDEYTEHHVFKLCLNKHHPWTKHCRIFC